ncbi:sensor histidine kinase [Puia dinghuensis]|uniref:histidine kinase n=1 Tax=Puia dinghuensis TaxID=1792502 RepID=A0A8J2UHL4_9BACT|nr:HAMP domain-containing sensor histidine kinase [Puia dinghuensis]GGB19296.1 two-component sensor histidine kinase [Puia dinghuensis]
MKTLRIVLFRRVYLVVFLLILVMGLLFTGITYLAITNFYEASTQLLNKDVAGHIAEFTSPYGREGFDRHKADSVFYDAMVISPSAEVYFLDTTGRVIYYHGQPEEIKEYQVSLGPIERYLASGGNMHVLGVDPRDRDRPKIFSVSEVAGATGRLGYIYVILGSQQYRSVTQMLFNSRIMPMVTGSVMLLLAVSLLITILYIQRLREQDNIRRVKASEKERRDFMVNISHDLRTPMAIALGYAETLALRKSELRVDEEQAYGDLVVAKLRQMDKMVNQLFELSKMESASFEAHREPFVFSEMMQEVLHALGTGGRVELLNGTDGSWIEADVSMMERVVQNLVVNALAYTPSGGRIEIVLERLGEVLVFRISNAGAPLPADLVKWINTTDAVRPGRSAIGLAIVRKILLLHGFAFHVEVKEGENVFVVRMPVFQTG